MDDVTEFYQTHLDRVSRSFAFCIAQLRSPLREWVGLSYLLCRVVDTIEDAAWDDVEGQLRAFACFDRALAGDAHAVRAVRTLVPPGVPQHELDLLDDAERLMRDFADLDPRARDVMRPLIQSMSLGMQHYARQKPLVLRTTHDVNRYCFFVAGVVGELLAGLLSLVDERFVVDQAALLRAHHFGQFLQKVNVLKDQVDDEKVGRHLVPSRADLESDARRNARAALAFLLSVPAEQIEFRRFCAWSLFVGLETLHVTRDSVRRGTVAKVPRERTLEVIGMIEDRLGDDAGLTALFDQLHARLIDGAAVPAKSGELPTWFRPLYRGPLDGPDLLDLGL